MYVCMCVERHREKEDGTSKMIHVSFPIFRHRGSHLPDLNHCIGSWHGSEGCKALVFDFLGDARSRATAG